MTATVTLRTTLISALAIAALALPATASGAVRLTGDSSQCPPEGTGCAAVELTHNGKKTLLSRFKIEWEAACTRTANVIRDSTEVADLRIRRGRFGDVDSYPQPQAEAGYSATVQGRLNGRLKRNGTATGTFSLTYTVLNAAKQEVDTCTTPPVTWKARRGRAAPLRPSGR